MEISEQVYDKAYRNIDKLNLYGGSIKVMIDNEQYYFVGDFGQYLSYIKASTYDKKYKNNSEYNDKNNTSKMVSLILVIV